MLVIGYNYDHMHTYTKSAVSCSEKLILIQYNIF